MFVSRVVARVEPELKAWRNRPLEPVWAAVFIDAIHLKVRHAQGVRSTALYILSGFGEGGIYEVLGVMMAPEASSPAESARHWQKALMELRGRGVETILMMCCDGLPGLETAIKSAFPMARMHRCVVHMVRASTAAVPWAQRKAVCADLRAIYQAPTWEAAELALDALKARWGKAYPALVKSWEEHLPELSGLWDYSLQLRKMVYTTNAIENLNRQIRKVTKNRGSFPNADAALQLVTMVLRQRSERAQGQNRRKDWIALLSELHITFAEQLPKNWGYR